MKMNKEERLDSVVDIVTRKENQFMEKYRPCLQGIYDELDMPCYDMEISDLDTISQRLFNIFFVELLEDEEFLHMEIKEHFHMTNGTHIFCLEIIDVQEPCPCCANMVSEWLAVIVNKEKRVLDFGFMKCNSYDRVEASSYRGSDIHEIIALLGSDD